MTIASLRYGPVERRRATVEFTLTDIPDQYQAREKLDVRVHIPHDPQRSVADVQQAAIRRAIRLLETHLPDEAKPSGPASSESPEAPE